MSIVKTKNLIYEYLRRDEDGNVEGVNRAVDDVSLGVRRGEFIAIVGHNGSGKSTLAKHMNAILQPTRGTVWVDGIDTSQEEQVWAVRQRAGMVFQNPDNQIIGTIVEEDVGFGPENMGVPTPEIWERVEESLQAVSMLKYRHHSPNKLSGGQKQRVAIARMLVQKTPICIFDDSLSAVDAETDAAIREALLKRDTGTTILISHRISTLRGADTILVLENGSIVQRGSHQELVAQEGLYRRICTIQNELDEAMEGGVAV